MFMEGNQMKRILVTCFLVVFTMVASFIGVCNAQGQQVKFEWPKVFIATSPGSGQAYSNLLGWSAVIEKATKMRTRVVANDVPPTRAKMLNNGTVNIDFDSIGSYTYVLEAANEFASRDGGPFQVRVGYVGFVTARGFVVRGDSKIKTIYDIGPGTKIAQPPQPGIKNKNYALLAWLKLDKKDIVEVNFGNFEDSLRALADGRVDVVQTGYTGGAVVELASNPDGIRVLPLPYKEDPEGAARFLAVNPVESFGICTEGIKEAKGMPSIVPAFFHFWSAKSDPRLVYNMAKWFAENHAAYKANESSLPTMTLENFRESLNTVPFPVHEGTIQYLKEKGLWKPEDDARQQKNIALIDKYIKAYKEAIAMADKKNINVSPTNKVWTDLWQNYKNELKLPRFEVKI
jgi:TRAP transporter TAXI family solute receptor